MFKKALKIKFDKGAKEHHQPWDLEHIDARGEMMDELLDLYNYAKLYSDIDKVTAVEVMVFAKETWERLEDCATLKK